MKDRTFATYMTATIMEGVSLIVKGSLALIPIAFVIGVLSKVAQVFWAYGFQLAGYLF